MAKVSHQLKLSYHVDEVVGSLSLHVILCIFFGEIKQIEADLFILGHVSASNKCANTKVI